MKILQIAPAWIETPPLRGYGGTEWVIYNVISGLTTLGHDVTLFATKNSKSDGHLKYVFTKNFLDLDIPWEAALPSLLHYHQAFREADKFDMVHAHLSSQTDLCILPFLADLTDKGIPNVMTIHGHKPFDRFTFMDQYYLKYYAKKISVINISHTMEDVSPAGFPKAGVAYNSLAPSQIKFSPKGGKYLTWLGKIVPDKGIDEAIQIAKKCGEKLVFAGLVDRAEKKSVEYFGSMVKPYIDGNQIVFLGPADLKLKNKLLGGAKAFLNPIQWMEPFGMVMLESLAAGTPVISYARGAANELIKDDSNGFLVKTPTQMMDAISKIDTIKREDCRASFETKFTPEMAALAHVKIYEKLIKKIKK